MDRTEMRMQNHEATLKSLEMQVGQFAQHVNTRPMGGLPSNTEVAKGPAHEHCKAISTRSGKQLADPKPMEEARVKQPIAAAMPDQIASAMPDRIASAMPEPTASATPARDKGNTQEAPEESDSTPQTKFPSKERIPDDRLPPPFPQRLKRQKQEYQFKKFLDILKQVHINLPLVEAIEQMPNYAKFLKDIISKRTRIGEFETVAVTEGCMALLHNKMPPKLKDPGSFIIPCAIGNYYAGKALCDLGASINLMPKSVFLKLGIGKPRPTTVML
jgi:hypothetical protein